MSKDVIEIGWNFDNSYITLPEFFYSKTHLNKVVAPELIILNKPLAKSLGLNSEHLESDEGVEVLSGNKALEEGAYIAQAYAGHQYGHFTMLGDGRALLIGEQITPNGKRYDIQLKGSGRTPYSRGGDGRAALGPMLREYIISEAMQGLNIPTTRSLSVVTTGEGVIREGVKEGAILTRIALSHIRFGTFEYALRFGDVGKLRELADYTLKRHYPHVKNDENKYINLLNEVIKNHASLVSAWQGVGFIHGVMNTDNMTISGETIDYGPCAFMDNYNRDTVFSSIDTHGRYAYKNQPVIAQWNLCRLAESLIPLLHENEQEGVKIAQNAISKFNDLYHLNWHSIMRAKLGLFNQEDDDVVIIEDLFNLMEKYSVDYTNTFISLTFDKNKDNDMFKSEEFNTWYKTWSERLERQPQSREEVETIMKNTNPGVIPRNHRVEEALEAADKGDFNVLKDLLDVVSNPFQHSDEHEKYTKLPEHSTCGYKTYCGT